MRHIAIYGLFGSTVFLHIISHSAPFSKKKIVFWVFLHDLYEIFLIIQIIQRLLSLMHIFILYCILYSCQILLKLEFSLRCSNNTQIPQFTKLVVAFSNFTKALKKMWPENCLVWYEHHCLVFKPDMRSLTFHPAPLQKTPSTM